jgi:hypothetical protein
MVNRVDAKIEELKTVLSTRDNASQQLRKRLDRNLDPRVQNLTTLIDEMANPVKEVSEADRDYWDEDVARDVQELVCLSSEWRQKQLTATAPEGGWVRQELGPEVPVSGLELELALESCVDWRRHGVTDTPVLGGNGTDWGWRSSPEPRRTGKCWT